MNPVKFGRCFKFLNEYYEFGHGNNRRSSGKLDHLKNAPLTQKELS